MVVEVKVDSGFGPTQIPRYRQELWNNRDFHENKFFVSLTKRPKQIEDKIKQDLDAALSWSDIQKLLQAGTENQNTENGFILNQFAEFLKSRGMYFMAIPPVTDDISFKEGIRFCREMQKILQEASAELPYLSETVRLKEWGPKGLWIEAGNKKLWIGFRLCSDDKDGNKRRLCVETNLPSREQIEPQLKVDNMKLEPWGKSWKEPGFSIYGDFNQEMNGKADKIRDWYERAIKLMLRLTGVKGQSM